MCGTNVLRISAAIFLLALLVSACGGKRQSSSTVPLLPQAETETPVGSGTQVPAFENQADQDLAARLESRLKEALAEQDTKTASVPPTGNINLIADLNYASDDKGHRLIWQYRNCADYDQNGTVGISDITPLVAHFGETREDNPLVNVLDGDLDGAVGIGDVTAIAQHYGNNVSAYIIESAVVEEGYYTEVGVVDFDAATGGDAGWKEFLFALPLDQALWYRVVPVDESGVRGIASIAVQFRLPSLAPRVLSVTPLYGVSGHTVQFSALVSGSIPYSHAWDFGDAATPALSHSSSPIVQMVMRGIYVCSLTVESGHGQHVYKFVVTVLSDTVAPSIVGVTVAPNPARVYEEVTMRVEALGSEPLNYIWELPTYSEGWGQVEVTKIWKSPGKRECEVTVSNSAGEDTYSFSVYIQSEDFDEIENNDSFAEANLFPAMPFENFRGSIGSIGGLSAYDGDDVDFFYFFALENTLVKVTGSDGVGLRVFDPNLQEVTESLSEYTGIFPWRSFEFVTRSAGNYYVNVKKYPNSDGGFYTLITSVREQVDYDEIETSSWHFPHSPPQPVEFPLVDFKGNIGSASEDEIAYDGDSLDQFEFQAMAGWAVKANLRRLGTESGELTMRVRKDMTTHYEDLQSLEGEGDLGLEYTFLETGTFILAVIADNYAVGSHDYALDGDLTLSKPVVVHIHPRDGHAGSTAVFSSEIVSCSEVSYEWDFGAAATPSTSSAVKPVVTLGETGEYECSLTVSNEYGETISPFTLHITDWYKETISPGVECYGCSMALDTTDTPHVMFSLKGVEENYATRVGSNWVFEDVPGVDYWICPDQAALDSVGQPIMVEHSTNDLEIVRRLGGVWSNETVEVYGRVSYPALFLDDSDLPHIAFFGEEPMWNQSSMNYAHFDGNTWILECVDDALWTGLPGIALDSLNRPHVSYSGPSYFSSEVYHAYRDGDGWHIDELYLGSAKSSHRVLVGIDSNDVPHILCSVINPAQVLHLWDDGTGWQREVAYEAPPNTVYFSISSMVMDSQGQPSVLAYAFDENHNDWEFNDLILVRQDDGVWRHEMVAYKRRANSYGDLALASDDTPRITYFDGTVGILYYVYR